MIVVYIPIVFAQGALKRLDFMFHRVAVKIVS